MTTFNVIYYAGAILTCFIIAIQGLRGKYKDWYFIIVGASILWPFYYIALIIKKYIPEMHWWIKK